jgi:hypothetical protein
MTNMTLNDVYQAAMQLPPEDRDALIERLQLQKRLNRSEPVTRETLLAELERRRAAGLYENLESLRGKYASPAMDDVTDEQLLAHLHEIATEWESELDEYGDNPN